MHYISCDSHVVIMQMSCDLQVLKKQPFQDDLPNSHWQCFQVKWDDGATDLLSPWDMEPEGSPSSPVLPTPEEVISAWSGEGEQARIIRGLEIIMEELEEAEMYVNPVDLEEEAVYCTVAPFPTDLTTITQRLKNNFYRLENCHRTVCNH